MPCPFIVLIINIIKGRCSFAIFFLNINKMFIKTNEEFYELMYKIENNQLTNILIIIVSEKCHACNQLKTIIKDRRDHYKYDIYYIDIDDAYEDRIKAASVFDKLFIDINSDGVEVEEVTIPLILMIVDNKFQDYIKCKNIYYPKELDKKLSIFKVKREINSDDY
jgi:hypothetical protein